MAAGLKRDPIVILCIDGEDLLEYINGPSYEAEMVAAHSLTESAAGTLQDCIIKALELFIVEQGMPSSSDPWVVSNFIEPAMKSCAGPDWNKPVSQETFLVEFKKVAEHVAQLLREQHVIVAHSEVTFDGSGIRRLLSNKFELDKTLSAAIETMPKENQEVFGKISKEYLRVALDVVAPTAGLPPLGAVEQMDKIVLDVFKLTNADDGKLLKKDEFKKILTEILGTIMLQLKARVLEACGGIGFVQVAEALDGKPDSMEEGDWRVFDEEACSILRFYLSEEVQNKVVAEKSSKDILDKLERFYLKKGSFLERTSLKIQLYKMRMDDGSTSLRDHLEEFNRRVLELSEFDVEMSEEDKVSILLATLPEKYNRLVMGMLYAKDSANCYDVEEMLLFNENKNALVRNQDRNAEAKIASEHLGIPGGDCYAVARMPSANIARIGKDLAGLPLVVGGHKYAGNLIVYSLGTDGKITGHWLDEVGALRRSFLTENHNTWRLFTFSCLHAGAIHLVINLCSVIFIGIHLEQEFGTLIVGLIYVVSAFIGTLVAALFVETQPAVNECRKFYET